MTQHNGVDKVITEIQRNLAQQLGRKVTAHYREHRGVLFVPEGFPLEPQNVIQAIPDEHLRMMAEVSGYAE